ncbi:hypothetical protein FQA47_022414 [Oryzias melastigma]|uniref:Uncharacterized protein n=1 Tax=Oryzias melastigma TaxID=30732 RepID=A0A834L1Y5_ORYME|nr:hypothetical protein FQA47_022414 [Oryzias melastigma]
MFSKVAALDHSRAPARTHERRGCGAAPCASFTKSHRKNAGKEGVVPERALPPPALLFARSGYTFSLLMQTPLLLLSAPLSQSRLPVRSPDTPPSQLTQRERALMYGSAGERKRDGALTHSRGGRSTRTDGRAHTRLQRERLTTDPCSK